MPPPLSKKRKAVLPDPKDIPPKKSFFIPKSNEDAKKKITKPEEIKNTPLVVEQKQPIKPRRFVYDEDTGEPYAEWINGEAVCLETGDVLFESRSSRFDEDHDAAMLQQQQPQIKFDYAVPNKGGWHPLDPTITTQSLIDSNIISLLELRDGKAGITLQMYTDFIGRGGAT